MRRVWGFGYPCASSTHGTRVYSNFRPLQRLVIHLVARVLNGFWFSKNTRISQNTTSITNRLKLLTPKVQTLLKTIPQNYCKLLLQKNSNLNYLLQVKTHNSVQQANSLNKINIKTQESSSNKLNKRFLKR